MTNKKEVAQAIWNTYLRGSISTSIFYYTVSRWDWIDCKVNQMWIEEIEESYDVYKYVAVAHNPRNGESMVMSNPRSYDDTLEWVRKFCCSFCILPV